MPGRVAMKIHSAAIPRTASPNWRVAANWGVYLSARFSASQTIAAPVRFAPCVLCCDKLSEKCISFVEHSGVTLSKDTCSRIVAAVPCMLCICVAYYGQGSWSCHAVAIMVSAKLTFISVMDIGPWQ
eukprot:355728-Amphidinium_carterae.1